MEIQVSLNISKKRSDLAFYQAYYEMNRQYKFNQVMHLIKSIFFIAAFPVDLILLGASVSQVTIAFIFNLSVSLLGFTIYTYYICNIFQSLQLFLKLAQESNHLVENQFIDSLEDIKYCISPTIFIGETGAAASQLDEKTKNLYVNIAKIQLNQQLIKYFTCLNIGLGFMNLISYASMLYCIVVLSTVPTNAFEKCILIMYVVYVGLSELMFLFYLVLLLLAPLICFAGILYVCCCNKRQSSFIALPHAKATSKDIVNAGGDCSICYQSILIDQNVFILPCSQNHVYHVSCLNHWLKVKNTCPICRAEIPMGDKPLEEAVNE